MRCICERCRNRLSVPNRSSPCRLVGSAWRVRPPVDQARDLSREVMAHCRSVIRSSYMVSRGDVRGIDCLDRRTPSDNPFPPLSIPLPQIHRRSPLSTRTLPSFQLQQDAGILCQPDHRHKDIQINVNRLLVIPHKLQRRNLFRFEILISLDLLLTENRI